MTEDTQVMTFTYELNDKKYTVVLDNSEMTHYEVVEEFLWFLKACPKYNFDNSEYNVED